MFPRLLALGLTLLPGLAAAETVGVTMSELSQPYIKALAGHIEAHTKTLDGVTLDLRDANGSLETQLAQIKAFIDAKVDAIVVNSSSTDAGVMISRMGQKAGIPMVFVNQQPINAEVLPEGQAYVGSDERQSGTLEFERICQVLGGKGRVSFLIGALKTQAARVRTQDYYDLMGKPPCTDMVIVDEAFGNWTQDGAKAHVERWIKDGTLPDAIIANNDEMALGAIAALEAAGVSERPLIAGIDATAPALAAMKRGALDVTVLQNAKGQGEASLDAALKLARGESTERLIFVPFELVTPDTLAKYTEAN